MKKVFWIVIGFILGIIVTLTVQYVCFFFRMPFCIYPPTAVIAPKSVSLDAGKMALVKAQNGTALINFTSYGDYGAESTYRWRFRSRTGVETKGVDSVKEIARKGQPVVAGGIKGGIKLGWSWGSKENCWLYYFSQDMTIQMLADVNFDTENLR